MVAEHHREDVTHSLKVAEVSKHYAGAWLFRDISFELHVGEILAVTGWNGSGKSTLLRIIAGLVKPSTGDISMFLEGQPISKESRRQFVGMVAPAISLYDELTGLENIAFFCRVRGVAYDSAHALRMLERIGLTPHAQKMCGNYSSGMKQRLKLVQALLHKPPLLLLDEPGCNLDSEGMKIVGYITEEQRKTGLTVIASNEEREVHYADKIINLSE